MKKKTKEEIIDLLYAFDRVNTRQLKQKAREIYLPKDVLGVDKFLLYRQDILADRHNRIWNMLEKLDKISKKYSWVSVPLSLPKRRTRWEKVEFMKQVEKTI